jgi:hypothetical protein
MRLHGRVPRDSRRGREAVAHCEYHISTSRGRHGMHGGIGRRYEAGRAEEGGGEEDRGILLRLVLLLLVVVVVDPRGINGRMLGRTPPPSGDGCTVRYLGMAPPDRAAKRCTYEYSFPWAGLDAHCMMKNSISHRKTTEGADV